jgi:hypothetical protein
MSSEEEKGNEEIPTFLIREICAKLGEVQSFVERYHPNTAVASCSINIFNDNVVRHFRNILKLRQKQITLDNFLERQRPSGSEAESDGAKRLTCNQRIVVTLVICTLRPCSNFCSFRVPFLALTAV